MNGIDLMLGTIASIAAAVQDDSPSEDVRRFIDRPIVNLREVETALITEELFAKDLADVEQWMALIRRCDNPKAVNLVASPYMVDEAKRVAAAMNPNDILRAADKLRNEWPRHHIGGTVFYERPGKAANNPTTMPKYTTRIQAVEILRGMRVGEQIMLADYRMIRHDKIGDYPAGLTDMHKSGYSLHSPGGMYELICYVSAVELMCEVGCVGVAQ